MRSDNCGNHPMFRPPGEAESLILRVVDGCPSNTCSFCGMYKGVPYREYSTDAIREEIREAAAEWPGARRVFLADGDAMKLSADLLRLILTELGQALPRLIRVSLYANGSSILAKTPRELQELRELKLHTLYMGLESGDPTILASMHKGEAVPDMVLACQRAQACGLRMSIMILLGLGGRDRSSEHATATAQALNAMQPRLLSALRVVPVEGTTLAADVQAGRFNLLSEYGTVRELRDIVAALELERTVFRANHTSNILPLEGRFPKDRERLVSELEEELAAGALDRQGPGPMPLWL